MFKSGCIGTHKRDVLTFNMAQVNRRTACFFKELSQDYYVWERVEDEGGWSDILKYYQGDDESYEKCIYGFDAMLIDKSVSQSSISSFSTETVGENYLVAVSGEYTALNDLI